MKPGRIEVYLAIFIISVIAITGVLYLETQENAYGIFPEKLSDMSIALYQEGDMAITEVKNLHNGAVSVERAYIAYYRSPDGNTARFWVSESKNNNEATALVEAMNRRMGTTGTFSKPTTSSIKGIPVYSVSGLGEYHHYYAKDNKVFWVQINNPDKNYQLNIIKESLKWS